ncbi:SMP-30/gluconolactonase/LRE family protein [Granulicella sibirica]|uniref:Gluconolactonase n=1 Tax=Granulicella sibirica TaxID=2479048 RepID=A0A4Q0SXM1_9BACT|nr:SMP-30/gluconolactonase/LRE family protein [Granulicella sibirica]RXH54368.1 Gluconolactonase [Granulicella sibirica]
MPIKAAILLLALLPSLALAQTIQPLDPSFSTLIAPQAKLNIMGKGFGFTEGPVWDLAGYLYVSDEEKNTISRLYPDGHREQLLSLGDPDGSTLDAQGRLIDCASVLRGIIRLSPDGKTYDILADHFEGKRFNSPNDVVPGPDGALYFTDPTLDLVAGEKQEIPYQGVYRLAPDGKVTLLTKDLDQPNGLAFTPDGQFLYIDDSARKNIRRYRVHPDGTLSDGILFADENVPGAKGVPDGMKLDLQGNLYVTGPGGIWVWNPAGRHLGTILVPEQPANLAWGGPHNSLLFITAGTSVYTLETKATGFVPYLHKEPKR